MDEMGFALGVSPEWDEKLKRKNIDWFSIAMLFAIFSNGKKELSEIVDMAERLKNNDEKCVEEMLTDIQKQFLED